MYWTWAASLENRSTDSNLMVLLCFFSNSNSTRAPAGSVRIQRRVIHLADLGRRRDGGHTGLTITHVLRFDLHVSNETALAAHVATTQPLTGGVASMEKK